MDEKFMLLAVVLPLITGVLIPALPFKNRKQMCIFMETGVLLTSVLVILLLLNPPSDTLTVFRFTGNLSITFRIDGAGSIFACMAAVLWPLAMLYSFEYMQHELIYLRQEVEFLKKITSIKDTKK